jgi:uncharacterized protein (DUF1501 family)
MTLSRRRFLQGLTVGVGGAALGACSTTTLDETGTGADGPVPGSSPTAVDPGADPTRATGDGTLVIVTLAGGNDALNTVAPVRDERYRSSRGPLALDPATALDLGDGFALHPSLTRTKGLWDAGRLAVVHGVGFAELDRSHFHCMDVWQAADPSMTTGWIGRWLDAVGTHPLDAVAVGRQLPLLARGERRSAAVVPTGPFALPGDASLRDDVARLVEGSGDRPALADAVARSGADLLTVVDTVAPVVAATPADGEDLSARLATVADLIDADLPTRVYATELGGFDTHAAQAASHADLLAELDAALGSFLGRTGDRPVTVLVYSEFGRRVVPNASGGTDHGRAGTVLVAGRVRGGHHGDPPPLDELVDGDLRTTTDYRSVYGALAEDVLGVPAADLLPGVPPVLTLVS